MDEVYLEFCKTDRQREILQAVISEGSQRKAAKALDCARGTVSNVVSTVLKYAATQGYDPNTLLTNGVTPGFKIKGVSTLYNASGEIKSQWVKTNIDAEEQHRMFLAAIEEMKQEIPRYTNESTFEASNDLMNFITITDYHLGMIAWGKESGVDWNTDKAVEVFNNSINCMMERAPIAETTVLNLQGDFLHTDSIVPLTPSSGHVLDTDARFGLLIERCIAMIKISIEKLLTKSNKVILLIAEGNHDITSSQWLQALFNLYYENEPRVHVVVNPNPYYCILHGQTMLMVHHGHKMNVPTIANSAASLYPEEWGKSKYRYAHVGHRHHKEVKENYGIIVEQHQTLSARDAYSARGGWTSERGATIITYSPIDGEISRVTIRP